MAVNVLFLIQDSSQYKAETGENRLFLEKYFQLSVVNRRTKS
jgi:hypothetical protein